MKKYLVLLLIICAHKIVSQTSIAMYLGSSSLTPMTNGTNIATGVFPNGQRVSYFRLQNLSVSSNSFGLNRKIIVESPTLCVDNDIAVNPLTYMCFASTCEGPACDSMTPDKHAVLGPMGSTSVPFDNTTDNSMYFKIYLDEGPTSGYYVVEYTVYNATTPSDRFVFTITYNSPNGINENSLSKDKFHPYFSALEQKLYPNLYGEFATNSTMVICDVTGKKVFESKISELPKQIDCAKFDAGFYLISLCDASSTKTKKIIISK